MIPSNRRLKRNGVRKSHVWGGGLCLPLCFLMIALGLSFWKVNTQWMDLVSVQRDRRTAQASLAQAEETLSNRQQEVKRVLDGLSHLKIQNENKEQEVTITQAEVQRYKDECDVRRSSVKEKHAREIDEVVLEAKTKVAMELQSSKDREEVNHQAREHMLNNVMQHHNVLSEEVRVVEAETARVEMDRVLFRLLGNTSQAYVDAFYSRLKKGTFSEALTVNLQTVYSNQAMARGKSGLWFVDEEGERQSLSQVPPVLPEILPREDALGSHYPRGGAWHSCAVVGTSGILLHYKMGAEIDAHTAVFRMNESPVKGFEEFVGKRTTIRLVEDSAHMQSRVQPSKQMVLQQIKTKQTLQDFIDYKASPESMNLYYLAPDLELHVARYLRRGPVPWGFFAAFLAVQKCRKVTLYGFGSNHRGHMQYRYWDHEEPKMMMRSAVGSAYDVELNDMGLLAEWVNQSPEVLQLAFPCLSTYDCVSSCHNCTSVPLSSGGACDCNTPLPVPGPGYCADHKTPTNCFRVCPEGRSQCPGGYEQHACDELGVKSSEPVVGDGCS